MRHATQDDLDRLADLLADLRGMPELRERKPGSFSLHSHAFLHFHEDAGDLYADVKLDGTFQRLPVTTPAERLAFLRAVRAALG